MVTLKEAIRCDNGRGSRDGWIKIYFAFTFTCDHEVESVVRQFMFRSRLTLRRRVLTIVSFNFVVVIGEGREVGLLIEVGC